MDHTRATVLVIDDEPDMREMLAFDLSEEGYEVSTAESGVAALQAIRGRRFDVAVTDLKMPGMDGVQTLAALKEIDPDMEVIIATGYASLESAVACLQHGAFDYIQKPYDLDQIRTLLRRALDKSRLQGVAGLYEASVELVEGLNHADPLVLAVTIAGRVLHADAAGLVLTARERRDNEFIFPSAGTRPPGEFFSAVADRVLSQGAAIRIPSPEAQEFPFGAAGEGYASLIAYPLVVRESVLGALVLLRRADRPAFTLSDMRRGMVFITQIMMAVDNRRLVTELARRDRSLN